MSFLSKIFSHHPQAAKTAVLAVNWPGESGKEYAYTVYPIGTPFRPLPGNYIYARQDEDGCWVPIYIAQTRDLHQRLEGHVNADEAVEHGATHIHAHYDTAGQASRCTEERDLILHFQPVCNDPLES